MAKPSNCPELSRLRTQGTQRVWKVGGLGQLVNKYKRASPSYIRNLMGKPSNYPTIHDVSMNAGPSSDLKTYAVRQRFACVRPCFSGTLSFSFSFSTGMWRGGGVGVGELQSLGPSRT